MRKPLSTSYKPCSVEIDASGIAIKLTCNGLDMVLADLDRWRQVTLSCRGVTTRIVCLINSGIGPAAIERCTAMQIDEAKLNALVTTAVNDYSGAQGGIMMNLGHKLGLYKALAGAGPLSSTELSKRSGCAERYVRE